MSAIRLAPGVLQPFVYSMPRCAASRRTRLRGVLPAIFANPDQGVEGNVMRCLLLAVALLAGAGTAHAADDWRITTAAYGPVTIGMTGAAASAPLRSTLG